MKRAIRPISVTIRTTNCETRICEISQVAQKQNRQNDQGETLPIYKTTAPVVCIKYTLFMTSLKNKSVTFSYAVNPTTFLSLSNESQTILLRTRDASNVLRLP